MVLLVTTLTLRYTPRQRGDGILTRDRLRNTGGGTKPWGTAPNASVPKFGNEPINEQFGLNYGQLGWCIMLLLSQSARSAWRNNPS